MRWPMVLGLAQLGLFTACTLAGAPAEPAVQAAVTPGRPFTLAPAQSAAVGAERVMVTFDRVLSDSRCPRDVQCIQAGEAVVRVFVTLPRQSRETLELSTTTDGREATVGSFTVALTELAPVPLAGKPTPAGEYRATFVAHGP